MIYSMTGFGRGESSTKNIQLTVEIKSVNNRYCDVIVKMPKKFYVFEDRIKSAVKSKVSRGRVDVYINFDEDSSDDLNIVPNFELLDKYVDAYSQITDKYNLKSEVTLAHLLKIQEGLDIKYDEKDEEEYWKVLKPAVDKAVENLIAMRFNEGEKLKEDVLNRIANMEDVLKDIEKESPEILKSYKKKMYDRINDILEQTNAEIDENRLANEVAIYADKTDIAEEIVRIDSHMKQIRSIFKLDEPVGRKLDFLIQELNREVNTIGSKSPDIDISNRVIELKSDLEKIREQIQNIE